MVYLQDQNGNTLGALSDTASGNQTNIIWGTSFYLVGDIGMPVSKGQYKVKVVGYQSSFCFTGECGSGIALSAKEIFESQSDTFTIK